ncbi:E3 ubiquitin-protein ligase TRIM21-like [Plectropomus leopardus]|uniref:E3 ubiquitin-protein ligase TRIM21-like n=1 Tax=Plectropomus leopardus TaxID=160734 RepID=UPI001C4B7BEB|nr:E3 ubiquitin-protein ligase TRIM21-like [Plectropomus leopardus]XP_042369517.1 E3 ubiquitin-protein ligase TRIM21-like [Plectropomus leopardus]
MAAASTSLCEDQFLCSICLDVLTDPVSTSCGHNFCKKCITEHWDNCVFFDCPNCKKKFYTRPELQVNTFVSEMVAHFRQSTQQKVISLRRRAPEPGDVLCDICTGTKLKALKSCLVCLVSYCETHLEPHLTVSRLKRHQLINPLENLEGRICTEHDKQLELFCKTDQTCVCSLCIVSEHKSHDVVPLKEEYERKLADLCETEADIQQLISKKQLKIQEFKHSVNVSTKAADREIAESIQVFTKLREALERNQAKVIETVEEKHRRTEKQAEGFIKELEEEISELKKRSAEMRQLSHSEDHLNFLQSFKSVNAVQPTRDWKDVKVCPPLYEGTVRTAVSQLVKMLKNEIKRLLTEIDLKTVQQYAVDVTLDPDTANQQLILSEDGKQVHCGLVRKNVPDNPNRFYAFLCVLGKQFVSSGRFYFEVQVKGKTKWGLGVARESVDRKALYSVCTNNGYWTVWFINENVHHSLTENCIVLSLKSKPEKVGVFVDYDEGLVSFYDVDAAALIYAYTGCSFMEKLFPVFLPSANLDGKNSASLVICPVNAT